MTIDEIIEKQRRNLTKAQIAALQDAANRYNVQNAGKRSEAYAQSQEQYDKGYRALQNMGLAGRQDTQLSGEVPRLDREIRTGFEGYNQALRNVENQRLEGLGESFAQQTRRARAAAAQARADAAQARADAAAQEEAKRRAVMSALGQYSGTQEVQDRVRAAQLSHGATPTWREFTGAVAPTVAEKQKGLLGETQQMKNLAAAITLGWDTVKKPSGSVSDFRQYEQQAADTPAQRAVDEARANYEAAKQSGSKAMEAATKRVYEQMQQRASTAQGAGQDRELRGAYLTLASPNTTNEQKAEAWKPIAGSVLDDMFPGLKEPGMTGDEFESHKEQVPGIRALLETIEHPNSAEIDGGQVQDAIKRLFDEYGLTTKQARALIDRFDSNRTAASSGWYEYRDALAAIMRTNGSAPKKEVNKDEKDFIYRAVNGLHISTKDLGFGLSSAKVQDAELWANMTEDQKNAYNAIYETDGIEAANKYANDIVPFINLYRAEKDQKWAKEFAEKNTWNAVPMFLLGRAAFFGGVPQMLERTAYQAINAVSDFATGGTNIPLHYDYNSPTSRSGNWGRNIDSAAVQAIENDSDLQSHPKLRKLFTDAYQQFSSNADSINAMLLNTVLPGSADVLFFSNAGNQAYVEAIENGATQEQAMNRALLHGAAETIFEKISLEYFSNLFFSNSSWFNGIKKEWLKNAIAVAVGGPVEGSEELFTELANIISDNLVFKDESEFNRALASYDGDRKKAWMKMVDDKLWPAFAQGTIGGWLMGGEGLAGRGAVKGANALINYHYLNTLQKASQRELNRAGQAILDNKAIQEVTVAQSAILGAGEGVRSFLSKQNVEQAANLVKAREDALSVLPVTDNEQKNAEIRAATTLLLGGELLDDEQAKFIYDTIGKQALERFGYNAENSTAFQKSYKTRLGSFGIRGYFTKDLKAQYETERNAASDKAAAERVYKDPNVGLPITTDDGKKVTPMPGNITAVTPEQQRRDNYKARTTAKKGRVQYAFAGMEARAGLTDEQKIAAIKKNMEQSALNKCEFWESLSRALGIDFVIHDHMNGENGHYDRDTNAIHVSLDSKQSVLRVTAHEMTHLMKQASQEGYLALRDALVEAVGQETWEQRIKQKADEYTRAGQTIDISTEKGRALAEEETVAEYSERMLSDSDFVEQFVEDHTEAAKTLRGIIQRIVNAINKAFKRWENRYYGKSWANELAEMKEENKAVEAWYSLLDKTIQQQEAGPQVRGTVQAQGRRAQTEAVQEQQESKEQETAEKPTEAERKASLDTDALRNEYKTFDSNMDIGPSRKDYLAAAQVMQGLKKKSVNQFSSEDYKAAEPVARQYWKEMKTKSPFFRAWFGDWRAHDTGTKVSVTPIDLSRSGAPGIEVKNDDTGIVAHMGSRLKQETETHSKGKPKHDFMSHLMANADSLFRDAVLLDSKASQSGASKSKNTIMMHSFYGMCEYGGKQVPYVMYVEEYYDDAKGPLAHRGYELKNILPVTVSGLPGGSPAYVATGSINNVAELYKFVKSTDKSFTAAHAVDSALLNDDGTPKVFYHGTDATFEAFDRTKGRANMDIQGMFFSPYEIEAEGYGSNVGQYYLSIQNPASEGMAFKALNMFKGQNNAGVKAREYLEKLGYDGVVGYDEVIAFEPTQIKSATDNIGTFNRYDERYRYSLDTDAMRSGIREAFTQINGDNLHEAIDLMDNVQSVRAWAFKDVSRMMDALAGKNKDLRNTLHTLFEEPHSRATGNYANGIANLNRQLLDIGKRAGVFDEKGKNFDEKKSAAIQEIGEGFSNKHTHAVLSVVDENTVHLKATDTAGKVISDGDFTRQQLRDAYGRESAEAMWSAVYGDIDNAKRKMDKARRQWGALKTDMANGKATQEAVDKARKEYDKLKKKYEDLLSGKENAETDVNTQPYTLDDLKAEYPNDWEKLQQAALEFRQIYENYIRKMNQMLAIIYPHAVSYNAVEDMQKAIDKLEGRLRRREDEATKRVKYLEKQLADTERALANKEKKGAAATLLTRLNKELKDIEAQIYSHNWKEPKASEIKTKLTKELKDIAGQIYYHGWKGKNVIEARSKMYKGLISLETQNATQEWNTAGTKETIARLKKRLESIEKQLTTQKWADKKSYSRVIALQKEIDTLKAQIASEKWKNKDTIKRQKKYENSLDEVKRKMNKKSRTDTKVYETLYDRAESLNQQIHRLTDAEIKVAQERIERKEAAIQRINERKTKQLEEAADKIRTRISEIQKQQTEHANQKSGQLVERVERLNREQTEKLQARADNIQQRLERLDKEQTEKLQARADNIRQRIERLSLNTDKQLRRRAIVLRDQIAETKAEFAEYRANAKGRLDMMTVQREALEKGAESGESLNRMHRLEYRKDYFHHFREMEGGLQNLKSIITSNTDISPAIAGKSDSTKTKTRWAGIFQKRTGGEYTPNAFEGMQRYGQLAEYKLAFDPLVAYLREGIQSIRDINDETNRNDFIRYLENWTNTLAGKSHAIDRSANDSGIVTRKALALLDWINGRVIKNTLLYNVRSAAIQASNLTNAVTYVQNPADWTRGVALWHKAQTDTFLQSEMAKSNFLASRYMDNLFLDSGFYKTAERFGTQMLSALDELSCKATWWAAYSQYMRNPDSAFIKSLSRDYESAIDYADDICRRTHAGRGVGELAPIMTSRVVNFFAPFQVEVNNTYQLLKDNVKRRNFLGLVNMQVTVFLFNSICEATIGTTPLGFDFIRAIIDIVMGFVDDDDDEEETVGKKLYGSVQRLAGEFVGGLPYAAQVVAILGEDTAKKIIGSESDATRYGASQIGFKSFMDIASGAYDIIKAYADGGRPDYLTWVDELGSLANLLLPFGGNQLTRTFEGVATVARGYSGKYDKGEEKVQFAVDKTPLEMFHAALFGKYSLIGNSQYRKEKRIIPLLLGDYKVQDYSTGKLESAKEYKAALDIGLTGKGYFALKNDMGKFKSQDGKRQVIMSQSYTPEQKAKLDELLIAKDRQTKITNGLLYTRSEDSTSEKDWELKADYNTQDMFDLSMMGQKTYLAANDLIKSGYTTARVMQGARLWDETKDTQDELEGVDDRKIAYKRLLFAQKGLTPEQKQDLDMAFTGNKTAADYTNEELFELSLKVSNSRLKKAQTAQDADIDLDTFTALYDKWDAYDGDGRAMYTRQLIMGSNLTVEQKEVMDDLLVSDDGRNPDYRSKTWFELSTTVSEESYNQAIDAEKRGISPELYLQIYKKVKTLDAKDENGKTKNGLKKKRVMDYLKSIGLSNELQDYVWEHKSRFGY